MNYHWDKNRINKRAIGFKVNNFLISKCKSQKIAPHLQSYFFYSVKILPQNVFISFPSELRISGAIKPGVPH